MYAQCPLVCGRRRQSPAGPACETCVFSVRAGERRGRVGQSRLTYTLCPMQGISNMSSIGRINMPYRRRRYYVLPMTRAGLGVRGPRRSFLTGGVVAELMLVGLGRVTVRARR
jgi:hypothetical protein